jgi:DNA-binding transcriptional ArsR family regulator
VIAELSAGILAGVSADDLAWLATLLSDRSRAQLCLSLLDGRAWTATELAATAAIAPSTASEHLTRLIAAGLLVEHRQGRHRYLRLAGPDVARLLEAMLTYLGPTPPRPTLRAVTASAALARARTCYDHLAGRLGIAITDAMTEHGLLTRSLTVTDPGRQWLTTRLGIDDSRLRPATRPLGRACMDWTERRPHLAGTAGALLCTHMLDQDWIRRIGTSRAVRLTDTGQTALHKLLGIKGEH